MPVFQTPTEPIRFNRTVKRVDGSVEVRVEVTFDYARAREALAEFDAICESLRAEIATEVQIWADA